MTESRDVDALVHNLIISGAADTRALIAKTSGLSPSTVSGAVARLIEVGAIRETGETAPTGGRRARLLTPTLSKGRTVVIELGVHHALLALADSRGIVDEPESVDIDVSQGALAVLKSLNEHAHRVAAREDVELISMGLALPGPVDRPHSRVISPARMPGWSGVDLQERFSRFSDLPIFFENDARAGALGERAFRRHHEGRELNDFIYIKAGSAIGGAMILDGSALIGRSGLAGEFSHIPIVGGEGRPCKCGNTDCLETVASAESIRAELASEGLLFESNLELLRAAEEAVPAVVMRIRNAGVEVGRSVSYAVSFLNPRAIIIGGALSAVPAFIAGIRQSLHESCLPAIMDCLVIERSQSGRAAALWGLAGIAPHPISKEADA